MGVKMCGCMCVSMSVTEYGRLSMYLCMCDMGVRVYVFVACRRYTYVTRQIKTSVSIHGI